MVMGIVIPNELDINASNNKLKVHSKAQNLKQFHYLSGKVHIGFIHLSINSLHHIE